MSIISHVSDTEQNPKLSIFIPVHNEEASLHGLHRKLLDELAKLGRSFEVVYVDDGSTDGSLKRLTAFAADDPRVRVISFRRNYGQTAAMAAGIEASRGDVLVGLDADLQNDPADIARLLAKLDEGFDVVSGWRINRRDSYLIRVIPARAANWVISSVSGVALHDFGCTLKAYRRDVIKDVRLYGEMHRFIPIFTSWAGARIAEIPVTHYPRGSGRSKYGLSRTVKVLFDLLTIRFMAKYWTKPLYLFGGAGILTFVLSFVSLSLALSMKFAGWPYQADFLQTNLPVIAVVTFVLGIQFFLIGLVAEVNMRTYFESQSNPPYSIKSTINIS